MKTLTVTTKALLAAAVLMAVGCAKETASNPAASSAATTCGQTYCETPVTTTTPTGTGTDPGTTGYKSGSTASVSLNSGQLARLFYNSRPSNPKNVRMNVDLSNARYSIIISYIENGRMYEAAFGTQHPKNASVSNKMYNGWVSENGQQVWKGFFQDEFGAIVLIVDKYLSQGDGQAATILGGSIWFQNFNDYQYGNPVQGPLKMCWEITMGPYDCRSFLVNGTDASARVVMTSSSTPSTRGQHKTISYEQLGSFSGLSRADSGF